MGALKELQDESKINRIGISNVSLEQIKAAREIVEIENEAKLKIKYIEEQKPYTGQWATPNPLEIVVTLRQQQDNPDHIAGFVEYLRYGYGNFNEWTKLPAPLFFARVVRDYISAFNLEEDDDET